MLQQQEWEKYEYISEKFIRAIAKNMKLYDITPSVGRLFGVLYFSDEPMTLDELGQALDMSKTSMSTGVRALSDINMVETTFKRGIRKNLYQAEEDWYKSFTSLFGIHWRKHTEMNILEAKETIQSLHALQEEITDASLKEKIDKDIERIQYAKKYYQWLMQFIEVIETGKIFDFIPKVK